MAEALADERHIQFPAGRLRRDLDEVVAWLRETGRANDPSIRREVAGLQVRVREAEVLALRVVELTQAGRSAVVEAAANKVFHTELSQEIAQRAFAWGGTETLVAGHRVQQLWRQSLWETIGGGRS
jgi:alkylation response protein AidB-like acyl-CoA dehydrogenase